MSVTGEHDDRPGGGPQKVGVPVVDLMTGMYATTAILAALAHRTQTGQGDHIDIGMLDVGIGMLANQGMNYLMTGVSPRRQGNRHPNIQPQDVFRCRTGYLVLAVGNDGQYARLCEVLDQPDLATDPRFATNAERVANLPSLMTILAEAFLRDDAKAWLERLDAAGVPSGPINTIAEALAEPQVVSRGMVVEAMHASGTPVKLLASPMRFAAAALSRDRAPPVLGQHTADILRHLGHDAADIARLRATGVV